MGEVKELGRESRIHVARGGLWGVEMCQGLPGKVGQSICQADKNMPSLFGGKQRAVPKAQP